MEIVGTYVLGLPIPFSSISLTKEASVNLAGGWVKCCFPSIDSFFSISFSDNLGRITESFSSSIVYSYNFINPSNLTVEPWALNL